MFKRVVQMVNTTLQRCSFVQDAPNKKRRFKKFERTLPDVLTAFLMTNRLRSSSNLRVGWKQISYRSDWIQRLHVLKRKSAAGVKSFTEPVALNSFCAHTTHFPRTCKIVSKKYLTSITAWRVYSEPLGQQHALTRAAIWKCGHVLH